MAGNIFVVPTVEFVHEGRTLGRWADDETMIFDGVGPGPNRQWYAHCYGLRGFIWSVHGSFERTYYFSPDYVDGNLREHLETTIVSLWAIIKSELEAAIAAPNIYGALWQEFHREYGPKQAPADGGSNG